MWLCLLTVIIFNYNSWDVSSGGKEDTRVGRRCKESEKLILVLWGAIIGDDDGGTLLRRSGSVTATRQEHQCHCYCSVIRWCWVGNTWNVMWFQWTSRKPGSSHTLSLPIDFMQILPDSKWQKIVLCTGWFLPVAVPSWLWMVTLTCWLKFPLTS